MLSLFIANSPSVSTAVYNNYVDALESGTLEALQAYASICGAQPCTAKHGRQLPLGCTPDFRRYRSRDKAGFVVGSSHRAYLGHRSQQTGSGDPLRPFFAKLRPVLRPMVDQCAE